MTELLLPDFGDCSLLLVMDEDGAVVENAAAHVDESQRHSVLTIGGHVAAASGALRRAFYGGDAAIIGDFATDDAFDCVARAAGVHSAAVVPLGHEVIGGFGIFSREPNRYDRAHLPLLAEVGRCAERVLRPTVDPRSEVESLLAGVHHDLTNPLMAVRLNLEALSGVLPAEDKPRRYLESAQRAIDQMSGLLGELNEFLRPRDAVQADRERCIAGAAVSDVLEMLSPLAAERRIRLVANLDDAGAAVAIERHQLGRVLSNLLVNAIKYTQSGGAVHLSTARSKRGVSFRVQDNGPGLSSDTVKHIFDADWVAHSTIRRGNGLGLSIARRIIEARGGKIQVSSALGVGSTFVVSIPLAC